MFKRLISPNSGKKKGVVLIYLVAALGAGAAAVAAGTASKIIGPERDVKQEAASRSDFDQIINALAVYALQNSNQLPCPADGSDGVGQASNGVAAGTCTGASSYSDSNVVPWKTLGLDERDVIDGWGNRIAYFVDPDATSGVGLRGAESTVDDVSVDGNGYAIVLISRGEGGDAAWPKGCQGAAGCFNDTNMQGAGELENSDDDLVFSDLDFNETQGANYFDDVLAYRTKIDLLSEIGTEKEPDVVALTSANIRANGENSSVVSAGGGAGSGCSTDCVGVLGDEDSEGDTNTGSSVQDGTACLWYNTAIPFTEYIRTGFEYSVSDIVSGEDLGGFTLTLFAADAENTSADPTTINPSTGICGTDVSQRFLGHTDLNGSDPDEPRKLAIEFDTRIAGPSNDPAEEHIATRAGDTDVHTDVSIADCGASFVSIDGSAEDDSDGTNPDGSCTYDVNDAVGPDDAQGWLEDSNYGDYVRIELNRCDGTCTTCDAGQTDGILVKLLYGCDDANLEGERTCEDFSQDILVREATGENDDSDAHTDLFEFTSVTEGTGAYTLSACVGTPTGNDDSMNYVVGELDSVFIGFTTGTASVERPGVKLRNWGITSN